MHLLRTENKRGGQVSGGQVINAIVHGANCGFCIDMVLACDWVVRAECMRMILQ